MPMLRLVWNVFGTMGQSEADIQNHQDAALSFGADGFHNTLRKITRPRVRGDPSTTPAPAGWLGRNVKLFTTGEDVASSRGASRPSSSGTASRCRASTTWARRRDRRAGSRLYAYGCYGQAGFFILPCKLDVAGALLVRRLQPQRRTTTASRIVSRRQHLLLPPEQPEGPFLTTRATHRQRPASGPPANDQRSSIQAQLMP